MKTSRPGQRRWNEKTEKAGEPVSNFFEFKLNALREKIGQLKEKFFKQIDYQIRECACSLLNFHTWAGSWL